MLRWTQDLSVGVEDIDEQHRELFDRVNKLLDALHPGNGRSEVAGVIAFLDEYIQTHFDAEEEAMERTGYEGYGAHKAQHDVFRKDFADLKRAYEKENAALMLAVQTQDWLCDWLIKHISISDRSMGAHLKSRERSP